MKMRFAVKLILLIGLFAVPAVAQGRTLPHGYPRIANYYLNPSITVAEAERLARWDIVILGIEVQYTNPQVFKTLRTKNPDIIILAYVLSEELPSKYLSYTDLHHPTVKLLRGIDDRWWLTDPGGTRIGFWPGANMLNVTNSVPLSNGFRWNTYLPTFMHNYVMSTGLWDGIFYDNMFNDVSWVNGGNIDIDRSGARDSASGADIAWREGMQAMLDLSRRLEGPEAVIIGNGGGQYYPAPNGRLIEEFPSAIDGGWSGATQKYFDVMNRGLTPSVVIINGKSSTGSSADYQTMRYVLGSTLLNNGYFSFDEGAVRHAALWLYDEFHAYLGRPVTSAQRIVPGRTSTFGAGVWRRDFENGIVLVNSSSSTQTVSLGEGFEAIRGTQSSVNNGQIVTTITLAPNDGRILLKRQFTIDQGQYENGALVNVYAANGQAERRGFFGYDGDHAGGASIIVKDLDTDGSAETVVAAGNTISVYDARGVQLSSFKPYGSSYGGALSIAIGNFSQRHSGKELLVGKRRGRFQRVKIFTRTGQVVHAGFRPFQSDIPGGTFVAAGDINPDGLDEIIVGAGTGARAEVRVFDQRGKMVNRFFPYTKKFRGGVRVAAGDLTGDRKAEIVTAPGPGSTPHIRILNRRGAPQLPGFTAFSSTYRGGVFVGVDDLNHDGTNSIIISVPAAL